jgi:hypothetical protein
MILDTIATVSGDVSLGKVKSINPLLMSLTKERSVIPSSSSSGADIFLLLEDSSSEAVMNL